jgi:hypothetical protein
MRRKGPVGGRRFELGKSAALARGRWKGLWLSSVNPVLFGGTEVRDRKRQRPRALGSCRTQKVGGSHARESRAPFGGEREWSQPGARLQPCSCSKLGSRLRRASAAVESSVSSSVRRFGIEGAKKEAEVDNGESQTFESREILRVPMTTSWLQKLVRSISLLKAC